MRRRGHHRTGSPGEGDVLLRWFWSSGGHEQSGAGAGGVVRAARGWAPRRQPLVPVGSLPLRAGLGHGPRGLQRRRHAWDYFPHDHARSRAYRWNEDGLAGHLRRSAAALPRAGALERRATRSSRSGSSASPAPRATTARTPRSTGGTSTRLPTHSWHALALPLPAGARSPTSELVAENGRRGRLRPRVRAARHRRLRRRPVLGRRRSTTPRPRPTDMCMRITRRRNRGPETATLHVLPTLWFRNTWSWGRRGAPEAARWPLARTHDRRPSTTLGATARWPLPGRRRAPERSSARTRPTRSASSAAAASTPYPKDGINDHVVHGAATVNPASDGHEGGVCVPARRWPGRDRVELRLRLRPPAGPATADPLRRSTSTSVDSTRRRERGRRVLRRARSRRRVRRRGACHAPGASPGMLWGKQFYHYDVARWLDGDPASRRRRRARGTGATRDWRHLDNLRRDLDARPVGVPVVRGVGPGVPLRHAGARRSRRSPSTSCSCCCREWYHAPQRRRCPPTSGRSTTSTRRCTRWAALRVFEIDGAARPRLPEPVFHKLLMNFTWWVNRKDADGNNLFEGGFLGPGQHRPVRPLARCPTAAVLEQSDGTAGWPSTASTCWRSPCELAAARPRLRGHRHQVLRALRAHRPRATRQGPVGRARTASSTTCCAARRAQSRCGSGRWSGCIPLLRDHDRRRRGRPRRLPGSAQRFARFLAQPPRHRRGDVRDAGILADVGGERRLISWSRPERLRRMLAELLDEDEFLSPYGLRAVSRRTSTSRSVSTSPGYDRTVDYEPAESTTGMFGGNSNWRGPVWFRSTTCSSAALRRLRRATSATTVTVEYPTGSGQQRHAGRDRRRPRASG